MESIGGYRIIRRLGSGSRSDVYLGHGGQASGGEPRLAAIKVFQPHVPEASIDAEIASLSRLRHAHVLRLLDLATGPRNSPCLVLQRLDPAGLPRLLGDRRELEAGEAVTILAPLVAAVSAIHDAGIVHGRLGAAAVLFASSGAPVISGFGGARSIAELGGERVTPALLDSDPGVAADRESLVALAASVLLRVRSSTAQVAELTEWLAEQNGGANVLPSLEHRLFAVATPMPVRFTGRVDEPTVPHRVGIAAPRKDERPQRSEAELAVPGWLGQLALPPAIAHWLAERWADAPEWLVSPVTAVSAGIRSVRRKVWVVAAIGLLALSGAFVVASLPGVEERPKEQPGAVVDRDEPAPTPIGISPPDGTAATAPGDPVAAAEALLMLRAQCLRDRSILCLDSVHAPESSARESDTARIERVKGGGEVAPDPLEDAGKVTVIDRMGDIALLAVELPPAAVADNATASVLMIRTEAGWRFRSLLPGVTPTG